MAPDKEWKRYEKHVVKKVREWVGLDAKIEYDVDLPATRSGGTRQIDILVTTKLPGFDDEITIGIDCKHYSENLDVGHADAFVSLIEDVQTDHGYLITNKGWSPKAEARLERAMHMRKVPDETVEDEAPHMALALIDALPPLVYEVEWGDDHYTGEFWDNHFSNEFGALITYHYVERESPVPIDHPDQLEWLDDPVASGTDDELSWADANGRRAAARRVLEHYLGEQPGDSDLDLFVEDIASKWEDGQTWSVDVDEIESIVGVPPNISERR